MSTEDAASPVVSKETGDDTADSTAVVDVSDTSSSDTSSSDTSSSDTSSSDTSSSDECAENCPSTDCVCVAWSLAGGCMIDSTRSCREDRGIVPVVHCAKKP